MKKQTRQSIGVGILAGGLVLGIIFGVLACKNDSDDPCECPTKAHLGVGETCCVVAACTCTLQVYGTVETRPVYRSGNATEAQIDGILTAIGAASIFSGNETQTTNFKRDIDAIHIIGGSTAAPSIDGKILKIGASANVVQVTAYFNNNFLTYLRLKNGIFYAQEKKTAEQATHSAWHPLNKRTA